MAMSTHRLPKIFLVSSVAFASALLGGMGLAGYVQGDAFLFYKGNAPYDPVVWQPSAPAREAGYPIDATVQPAAYPSQAPVESQYLAEAYRPQYDAREIYASYGYADLSAGLPPAEAVEPVVQVSRGSWTQPVAFEAPSLAEEIKPEQAVVEAAGDTSIRRAPAPVEAEPAAAIAQP